MGKFNNGILGGFQGKVGNIVGTRWKGQNVMKIVPATVSNPRTPKQQSVRSKFAIMGHFLSTQRRLVSVGFRSNEEQLTGFNAAMKYNLHNAITGVYPDHAIAFSEVKLSTGQLPVLSDLQAEVSSELSITLNWTDNSAMEHADGSDLLMIGMYHAESAMGYTLTGSFKRSDATGVIHLPDNWAGLQVELYVFVVSTASMGELHTKEMVSETQYPGSLQLTTV